MRTSRFAAAGIEQLLGIELPVIQAPMAGVQDAALAAAISNAGGLGSLPGAMLNPAALEAELHTLTAMTDEPFNVNFFCHEAPVVSSEQQRVWQQRLAGYFKELGIADPGANAASSREPFGKAAMSVLEQFRPAVVSFHFGLPQPAQLDQIKRWGTRVLGCATTVDEALWLANQGVDAVIAQGLEAGWCVRRDPWPQAPLLFHRRRVRSRLCAVRRKQLAATILHRCGAARMQQAVAR